jgi:POT family proton-dependent oligopeptide transporter
MADPTAAARDTRFFGHPRGLMTLFFTEMWERFSYYGMRAILQLFMLAPIAAGGMGLPKSEAGPIYAMYTSLVYLLSIPGGWIADNKLGQRRSVLYGGIVIMLGHILLAMHGTAFFYTGLGCVILGTGLLKPNISAIVGQLYDSKDERRESGFSIFYMGINLGAFLSPLVCGWFAQDPAWQARLESWGMDPRNSWHWGFGAAAVGMFFGLVQYVVTSRHMGDAGVAPAPAKNEQQARARVSTLRIGIVLAVIAVAGVAGLAFARPELMTKDNINSAYSVLLFTVVVVFFGRLFTTGDWTRGERNRLIVITILFLGAAIFWGIFEQAGSTLTIFADESTNNTLFGRSFPSSFWQSVNAVLIVLLAPVFSWLWGALGKRNPGYAVKFGIGLAFAGLGFLWLVGGGKQWDDIWKTYVEQNRPAIIAAAEEYEVEIKDPNSIKTAVVSEIFANARSRAESGLYSAFEASRWEEIRADAAKYGVELGSESGVVSLSNLTAVIGAKKDRISDELLPAWERVNLIWLFIVYLLHTIGELCLSPVGLAAMTRLAPVRVVGLMMGVWFLGASVGNFLGGTVAGYYDAFELPTLLTMVATSGFVMAAIMFVLARPIGKMLAQAEAEGGAPTTKSGH